MELKLASLRPPSRPAELLIVPYGIETAKRGGIHHAWIILLIVPYGIETNYPKMCIFEVSPFNCTLWN